MEYNIRGVLVPGLLLLPVFSEREIASSALAGVGF